jgi:hypothetical protein
LPALAYPWATVTSPYDPSLGRSRLDNFVRPIVLPVAAGVGLGMASLLLEHTPEPLSRISAHGTPWLAVAFMVGALAGRLLMGARAGVMTLLVAVAAYYLVKPIIGSPINPPEYDSPLYWLVLAIPGGALMGIFGAAAATLRPWLRVLPLALLGAMIIGEFWLLNPRAPELMVAGTAVGLALPFAWRMSWPERIVGTAGAGLLALAMPAFVNIVAPLIVSLR